MTPIDFRSEAETLQTQLVAWRRDLHQHPELGFEVRRTAGIVAQTLGELGYEVRTGVGRTGVVALLHGGRPGPTVMLRADMDALPIQEINNAPYASQVAGAMHACGHDGHVAIGLGTARLLADHAAELPGRVLFVFQPAEEGQGGAAAMVADGALAEPTPDAAFGLHLWNTMPMGRVVAQAGPLMAAADTLRIVVRGRGGHGALPHETVDAVAVTGQVLSALQTIVSRNVNPQETAVLTIGTVHGGTAFNVIAETVEMQGTIRTFSPTVRETVLTRLRVLLDGVTAGLGATYELEVQEMTSAVVNDPGIAEIARGGRAGGGQHRGRLESTADGVRGFLGVRQTRAGLFPADRLRQCRIGLERAASQPAFRLRRARPAPRRGSARDNGGAFSGRDVRRAVRIRPGQADRDQFRHRTQNPELRPCSLCILTGRLCYNGACLGRCRP